MKIKMKIKVDSQPAKAEQVSNLLHEQLAKGSKQDVVKKGVDLLGIAQKLVKKKFS